MKQDKSRDVVELVIDIEILPRIDREVKMSEFLERLNAMVVKKEEESSNSQEEQKKVESDLNIDSIIEEAKVMRISNHEAEGKAASDNSEP